MIVYNVTVNIEDSVQLEWVEWMKAVHIPEVMDSKCFSEFRFTKVLGNQHGGEGTNYSIQYLCDSLSILDNYKKNYAPALQVKHTTKYGEKALAFRTIMEVL